MNIYYIQAMNVTPNIDQETANLTDKFTDVSYVQGLIERRGGEYIAVTSKKIHHIKQINT